MAFVKQMAIGVDLPIGGKKILHARKNHRNLLILQKGLHTAIDVIQKTNQLFLALILPAAVAVEEPGGRRPAFPGRLRCWRSLTSYFVVSSRFFGRFFGATSTRQSPRP